MIPYATYVRLVAESIRKPRLSPLDSFRLPLRVSPLDVELTRMNNGRYVTLMDLGRVGLALRCGLLQPMIRHRWAPLVGAVSVRYRRSLRIGQHYEIVTQVVAFDEKFFYFDQRFVVGDDTYTAGLVKALFRSPKGSVPTRELLAAAGVGDLESPPLPSTFQSCWQAKPSYERL